MNKLLLFVLLSLNTILAQKDYKLKGTVVEENGSLIAGAKIEAQDGEVTYTDFDGTFTINTYNCYGYIYITFFGFKKGNIDYDNDGKKVLNLDKIIMFKK